MKKATNPTMSTRGGNRRSLLCLAISITLLAGLLSAASGSAVAGTQSGLGKDVNAAGTSPSAQPRAHQDIDLASDVLRRAVARLSNGKSAGNTVDVQGSKINVEILHDMQNGRAKDIVKDMNGEILGSIDGELVQAFVPYQRLVALEAKDGVSYVRPPLIANAPEGQVNDLSDIEPVDANEIDGEQVVKTNADAWQAVGHSGAGVKVGIIDYFGGSLWDASVAAGELKPAAGEFCQYEGAACDVWAQNEAHGVGVGEIIYELAPDADLYVATVGTAVDLQAAVNYFHSQGVTIITRSLTAEYDGPGDGTGPIAAVIDDAVAKGIAWFNSAGNNSGSVDTGRTGSYWRSAWSDTDGDGWMNYADDSEGMIFGCSFMNGLRWSDWGPNKTDYDAYVYDDYFGMINGDPPIAVGGADQSDAGGAPPLEHPSGASYSCNGQDVLAISKYAEGNGTAGDTLEFMVNGQGVEFWQNNYSASGPASDPNSPGAMSIGAIDPPMGTSIADYSAWGPTNDERIKPDFSAAACVYSYVYSPDCFNGTSSATPVAAGVGALLKSAGVASTPAELKTWMMTNAMTDRGAAGADNVFGLGELILPDPTTGPGPDPDPREPNTTIDSGPSGTVAETNATFAFSSPTGGATFQCALDGSMYSACTSPKQYTGLADGVHTFSVRASSGGLTDSTPATRSWTVDTGGGPGPDPIANYRPDGHIKRLGKFYIWKGSDLYSTGAGQMWKISGKRGTTRTFEVRVQNDGDSVDSFAIVGTKKAGFSTQYFRGKLNITKKVLNGTYETPNLAPGSAQKITMKVKPSRTVKTGKTYTFKVFGISYGAFDADELVQDVVGVKYAVTKG